MELAIPSILFKILMIALLCSVLQTALMQKLKELPIVKKGWVTWTFNLVISLSLGIVFTIYFFGMNFVAGLWVGFIAFLGASAIYDGIIKVKEIKKQG
ncbi:hypothetical protein ACWG0P_14120 [Amedibacillus sp. YH-ame6]